MKNKSILTVDKQKLLEIEGKIQSLLPPFECGLILPDIRKLRYKPFRELVDSYSYYVKKLSHHYKKAVNPLIIEGGDFLVDPEIYYPFTNSLACILRSIIKLGFEPFEEHTGALKNRALNIKCSIKLIGNNISLSISHNGLPHSYNSFNTVLCEVDKLGGTFETKTAAGLYTELLFIIPVYSSLDFPEVSVPDILGPLIDTTKNFFMDQAGLHLESNSKISSQNDEYLRLNEISVIIGVKGIVKGTFIFSADKHLIKNSMNKVIYEFKDHDEEKISFQDIMAECANMILGGFLKALPDLENFITLETPVTLYSDSTIINYPSAKIWSMTLNSDKGNIDISFLSS
ncbi:MAG: chemotaxis protein CheX [Bacillota bacterium]